MSKRHSRDSPVSVGTDIRKPDLLQTRLTSEVLSGIASGEWSSEVERVRRFPHRSNDQKQAKQGLPYVTWSGEFAYRNKTKLIRHSGQVGVDVDDLTPRQCLNVISKAVFDPHCLAAFHSVSGRGVRLLIRVQPLTAEQHKVVFRQVVHHVRRHYEVEPDMSGSDVSRPCFVSFDKTIVINLSAESLPIEIPALSPAPTRSKSIPRANQKAGETWTLKAGSPITHARLVGSDHTPWSKRADGYFYTHKALLKLATSLALTAAKANLSEKDQEQMLDEAFSGWWTEAKRHGRELRYPPTTYRQELAIAFYGVFKKEWLQQAAATWTRWLEHPDFPHDGTKRERLLFAIRSYCREKKTDKFFLSSRDAGILIGASHVTASILLRRLKDESILSLAGRPCGQRQAHTYILK